MIRPLLHDDTLKLVALDKAMRKARSIAASVRTRVEFYLFALRNGHVSRLNNLADAYAPDSELSERSLNLVFEQGDTSTEVCRQLVQMASKDPSLAELLRQHMGGNFMFECACADLFPAAGFANPGAHLASSGRIEE